MSNENFTEYAEIPYYIKATSMTFCIVIMCLGVIGNVMVPIVILKTKDMRNSTNIFLVNLSIADLMVLLVCTPTVLVEVNSKPETWVLGKELLSRETSNDRVILRDTASARIGYIDESAVLPLGRALGGRPTSSCLLKSCLAVPFVELTVAHASVLTILAISFERYYAICEPLRAGYVCTKTRATLICALAWFFAALFTSPILAIAEHHTVTRQDGTVSSQCLTQAVTYWQITFFIMVIILLYVLPLLILIVLYSIIAKNLITAASKVVLNKTVDPYNTRARKQVILMLGTVVLCFFLCLMPYRVLIMWIIVTPSELSDTVSPEKWYNLLYFSRIMLYINSAINPILYNLMSSKFRIGFCKICICHKHFSETQNRRVQRTATNGSTTSSSLSRTTNSLKKFFSHRSSIEKSDESESKDNNERKHGFYRMFTSKRFIRQQSAPICPSPKVNKISRMRSEGNMLEVDAFEVDRKISRAYQKDVAPKFIGHSNVSAKNRTDIELDSSNRSQGSLRRSVLINSAKGKSFEGDSKKFVTYQKIRVECVVGFQKSRSVDPILGVATFTYEKYDDGTEVPVCLTQADTFWSALFFILIIAIFFIIPLGVLLVLYSVIAKNLMENPVIIAQHSKNSNNAGNVLRYRKQVILMLGTVVLSFFVCLLPFKALTLWIIVFPPETIMSLGIDGYYILLYFCRVMLYLNSAINPILYNLMSSKFRDGFVKLLKINKLMRCGRNLRENMQRRDTFNTTTSTGFSSSQNTSESFWRRYSNRASSQKYFLNRSSTKTKEVKEIFDTKVQQVKIGEIINVEKTRRNSMTMISAMNELNDNLGDIIKFEDKKRNSLKFITTVNGIVENGRDVKVDVHENNLNNELEETIDSAANKQIQILNLDVKTNSVYSVTLDLSDTNEVRNRFVCVPSQDKESKNIFVYDFKSNESFV
ncbi:Thyrotropin-releasing hormone receptor [Papilio xuthus]|uniref:Thyrotropin-releasing hormone receptor n=1 Tax=Papilio xuthus TaxID=66420 RepID=A0A194QJU9_PAPXU|nr:Thyrotropin-releasing hormone receptor [Papilio xuthus]